MSIKAAGYVLNVPSNRRDLLLNEVEHGGSFYRSTPYVAEPVPTFEHSRRAPLVVLGNCALILKHDFFLRRVRRREEIHLALSQRSQTAHANIRVIHKPNRKRQLLIKREPQYIRHGHFIFKQ